MRSRLFNDLECDELVMVDIKATLEGREPDYSMIEEFATEAFMPLTYGGGIRSIEQIGRILAIGIEKVVIGTAAPGGKLIAEAAAVYGSQSVVVAVDVRKKLFGQREVCVRSGTRGLGAEPSAYCAQMQQFGAGELFVQSIDLEGTRTGYDIALMQEISAAVDIPVVACGGAGSLDDMRRLLLDTSESRPLRPERCSCCTARHKAPLISYPRPAEIEGLRRPSAETAQ